MSRCGERAATAIVAVAMMAACDLSTKNADVTSISNLRLPSPSVVVGDVMRDSLGAPAPLSIEVFDAHGNVVANPTLVFSHLDSTISIDASGLVHGLKRDTVGARVVVGSGGLQTPQNRIFVSVAPKKAAKSAGASAPAITFDTRIDTTVQTNWSPLLPVTLTDSTGVGAQGFIATYSIVRSPAPLTVGVPTVYIANDAGAATTRDTSDLAGVVSRRVVLRQAAVGDAALLSGTKTDTIIVRMTATYRAAAIPGTPVDFVIPVAAKKP
jgi:hypothetical protein